MEVSKARPTGTAEEPARIDPGDGARESPWGEERIADELKLKLGNRVSPRTIRKYLERERPGGGSNDQHWAALVRNQAKAIVACDFFISITPCFRVLYVFVAMEIGSRRILQCNVTAHPTAEWTTQHTKLYFPALRLRLHDDTGQDARYDLRNHCIGSIAAAIVSRLSEAADEVCAIASHQLDRRIDLHREDCGDALCRDFRVLDCRDLTS